MHTNDSFFQERLKVKPVLPELLQSIETLELQEGIAHNSLPSIQELFPKTAGQPLLHFTKGRGGSGKPLKVGVILSGGQAAGGHNVIIGLFDALKEYHARSQLFGFLGGPSGLLEKRYQELEKTFLDRFRNTGGFDMIGSGRTKIEGEKQLDVALSVCQALALDGLVVIGGDDSNTNAAFLAEYFLQKGCRTQVIGVPKTIDGDLKNSLIEASFGFDTACKIYSEMIGNICRDAASAKKYTHFIKLMGRSASHIALECALQTHPNLTLIGEEIAAKKMSLKEITELIANCIIERSEQGKNYGVILIPEGLVEFIPEMNLLINELNGLMTSNEEELMQKLSKEAAETLGYLPREVQKQLLIDRDPHGNVQLSHISTEQLLIHTVSAKLKQTPGFKGKFTPVGHFFGYEGRCGYPSNFDANYCYALGYTAAALLHHGKSGYMSSLKNLSAPASSWEPIGVPITLMMDLEERKGKKKAVIKKTLVNLDAPPYKFFAAQREKWKVEDAYRFPGPIQFWGPSNICNETTYTIKLEKDDQKSMSDLHAYNQF